MRQLRHMLRFARDGASARDIAVTLGVARSTIQDNLKRAAAAGLTSSHRRYADWTSDRFRRWAASVGPETEG